MKKNYSELYNTRFFTKEFNQGEKLIFHKLQSEEFEEKQTFIFDIDHTLLKVSPDLKNYLNQEVAKLDKNLYPDKWSETYQSAKTKENFYDYKHHCDLLAEFIKNSSTKDENSTLIENRIFETLDTYVPQLVYKNLINFLEEYRGKYNLILATSGSGAFQSRKVASLINILPELPKLVIYVENLKKGSAILELRKLFPTLSELFLFDDNVDELIDVHEKCKGIPITLIRVSQKDGIYNTKELDSSLNFVNLNLESSSKIRLESLQNI